MYSRSYSVKETWIIEKLFRQQQGAAFGRYYIIKARPSKRKHSRFLVSVGKKIEKKATQRNLLRRRTASIIKQDVIPVERQQQFDFLIMAKQQLKDAPFLLCKKDLKSLFEKFA